MVKKPYNFALIGAAGYVAPRHLRAIKETNNNLVCALDPHDSVGILDSYFREVKFFTEFERFDRHIEKLRRESPEKSIDVVSICSPNYLHDAHIRFALRVGADVICEKPVVLNPWNIDALQTLERETDNTVNVVLQLRFHEEVQKLKRKIEKEKSEKKHTIDLKYITARGPWYDFSWKGDINKSGGIVTNIGIHFFDLLIWIFGKVEAFQVEQLIARKAKGHLVLEKAEVDWFLSIDYDDLPEEVKATQITTYRNIDIDGQPLEISKGFTDLHTQIYRKVLSGKGFSFEDARPAVELASEIRLNGSV
ncbi:MAG: Gfo/Idh/MocA family oxidoreductase [bacterium]